jgi:ribonuclease R
VRPTKAVLKALLSAKGHVLCRDEIVEAVADRGVSADGVDKALAQLEQSGRVYEVSPGRFMGIAQKGLVVGRISVTRKGYGFVEFPEGDIYVRARDMNGALHRDVVAARLSAADRGGRRSGEVAYVVERANESVVGRFERHGRVGMVVPSDKRIRMELLVAPGAEEGASDGDMVVARITRFPTTRDAAQGAVEEVLGPEGAAGVDVEVIVREHGLRTAFPGEALDEAAALPSEVTSEAGREDLRDLFTVTIDPPDARDFDDAISLERDGGDLRLWVHVADVSRYVGWGSAVDEEAVKRGTSVYLVDRVLPMLPERLSTELCSLRPGEDRFAMTVEMLLDRRGLLASYRLYPSLIRSDARLDYETVDGWLETGEGYPDDETKRLLEDFRELAAALGRRREHRGGLDFETVEAKVVLDEEGHPLDVKLRERTVATNMIEEAMIRANEVVAEHMVAHEAPMLFRIHENPDPEALAQVAVVLREFDYPIKDVADATPGTFQRIVKHAHGRPERLLINSLLLRALKRARYVDYLHSHFGLASEAYTHFTSPIRRYPDLAVHRLLKAQLAGELGEEPVASMVGELEWLAEHGSEAEREAEAAEDESVKLKLVELMADHVGEIFEGVIVGVSGFGLFVQLPNTAEGLVHVEEMTDDFYRFDGEKHLLWGEERGRTYRLGQEIRVRVIDVFVSERRIELEIA